MKRQQLFNLLFSDVMLDPLSFSLLPLSLVQLQAFMVTFHDLQPSAAFVSSPFTTDAEVGFSLALSPRPPAEGKLQIPLDFSRNLTVEGFLVSFHVLQ